MRVENAVPELEKITANNTKISAPRVPAIASPFRPIMFSEGNLHMSRFWGKVDIIL